MKTLSLNKTEKRIILNWYDYIQADTQHYGDGLVIFPEEQAVLDTLAKSPEGEYHLSDHHLTMIGDWMHKAVKGRFGGNTVLTPEEQSVYNKIRDVLDPDEKA